MAVSSLVVGVLAALSAPGMGESAEASSTTQLVLSQGAAFSLLGHSCGGIQEQVYATGFHASGRPTGDVYMQTRCGGSGRGGGYKTTTYSAWASVVWDWFGNTREFSRLEGAAEGISTSFSEEDGYGDRIYNVGTAAFLETTSPPLVAPGAPTGVSAELLSIETVEEQPPTLEFQVSWTPAGETAALITSSTVTATPVGSNAAVLSATVSGPASSARIGPLEPHTTYAITVSSSDDEGTSEGSAPIEASSSPAKSGAAETCEREEGTIKLSPGLEETAHSQEITLKGHLSGCNGPVDIEEGSYVAHLRSGEAMSCASLSSLPGEASAVGVSLAVKWTPNEAGPSRGWLT
ncbi:MAG TPA: fibronectin type III domain-containing protein, partial [Solirubrobacteraceae bacterium]|nr:fibronectin type III domain-containing protein [Solirubrobacteraceae bacterium]